MIQKQTLCIPADKSGVWVVRTIHTYTKLSNIVMPGGFGRISVRDASTDSWLKKKKKKKFLYIRSTYMSPRQCGLMLFTSKSVLLLKKRLTPVGRRVTGFISRNVNRKRAVLSFVKIL